MISKNECSNKKVWVFNHFYHFHHSIILQITLFHTKNTKKLREKNTVKNKKQNFSRQNFSKNGAIHTSMNTIPLTKGIKKWFYLICSEIFIIVYAPEG